MKLILPVLFILSNLTVSAQKWWLDEPIMLLQTNLRETDSDLDPVKLIRQVKDFPANTLLFSVGGITAHYPTQVKYHFRSDYLPAGKDLVGDVIKEAHRSGIRVIARFDFSRARKEVYQAHPEWFYAQKDGQPVVDDNELYSVCINGGYYHEKALEILSEALGRYPVDGLFFNWFGNISTDYKGNSIGLCHCGACESRFRATYGRGIPDKSDKEYEAFMNESKVAVAQKISDLIRKKRPGAFFMTYIEDITDGITSEADFYKWRSLPQWIYVSSEHVNRGLNSHPDKMVFNLVMPYQEMRYRFGSVPGPGLRALLYQSLAHGAFPAFVNLGTMDQPDRTAMLAVQPVFRFYEANRSAYPGQKSAARVILYPAWNSQSNSYRGFFRLLTELHVPFKVTDRISGIDPGNTDLVIVPEGPLPKELEDYVEKGGAVLAAGTVHPGRLFDETVQLWKDIKSSYMRLTDHTLFPSLKETDVLFWEGDYLELAPSPTPVTLIPPGQFGPPDKVSTLKAVTDKPGLVLKKHGAGSIAFIPWKISELYYLYSNDKHRLFVSDLIRYLVPEERRQLITNAHPSVEITVMEQAAKNRSIVHLINLSGHSGTGFFDAIEMRNIQVRIKGEFSKGISIDGKRTYPLEVSNGFTAFTIPGLLEYEAICLYPGR